MAFRQNLNLAAAAAAGFLIAATPATAGSFDRETVAADGALSSFDAVYIAPVALDLDLDVRRFDKYGDGDRPVDPGDAQAKADDLYDDLVDRFSKSFALADGPGPGVLTIEMTLTGLESSRPTMADYGRDLTFVSGRSVYAGGASMVATLSEDGAVLAEIGDSFDTFLTDGRSRAGIWQDADRAFDHWARQLVRFVERN